jgi:hypothetical protein
MAAARDEVGARLAAESAAGSFESLVRPVATAIDAVVTHFEVSARHCPGGGACNVALDVACNGGFGVACNLARGSVLDLACDMMCEIARGVVWFCDVVCDGVCHVSMTHVVVFDLGFYFSVVHGVWSSVSRWLVTLHVTCLAAGVFILRTWCMHVVCHVV